MLSTLGIITNGVVNSEYYKYFSLERSLMFEEVLTFVVSACCIHGALKVCMHVTILQQIFALLFL